MIGNFRCHPDEELEQDLVMATHCIVVADSASLLFTVLDHTIAITVRLKLPIMMGIAQMVITVFFLSSYKAQVVPPNFVKRLAELI